MDLEQRIRSDHKRAITSFTYQMSASKRGKTAFAWMITPLALLPTAGRCVIEVRPPLREKWHILDLMMWYEDGISKTYE